MAIAGATVPAGFGGAAAGLAAAGAGFDGGITGRAVVTVGLLPAALPASGFFAPTAMSGLAPAGLAGKAAAGLAGALTVVTLAAGAGFLMAELAPVIDFATVADFAGLGAALGGTCLAVIGFEGDLAAVGFSDFFGIVLVLGSAIVDLTFKALGQCLRVHTVAAGSAALLATANGLEFKPSPSAALTGLITSAPTSLH